MFRFAFVSLHFASLHFTSLAAGSLTSDDLDDVGWGNYANHRAKKVVAEGFDPTVGVDNQGEVGQAAVVKRY